MGDGGCSHIRASSDTLSAPLAAAEAPAPAPRPRATGVRNRFFVLTIIKRNVTGSVEVARASTGKFRNGRKLDYARLGVVGEVTVALGKFMMVMGKVPIARTLFAIPEFFDIVQCIRNYWSGAIKEDAVQ